MIVGVTHLTMEAELRTGIDLGMKLGFTPEFIDQVALPASFEGVEDHDHELPLALLAGPRGIRLELVEHGRRSEVRGAYTGIFRCPPPAEVKPAKPQPAVRDLLREANVLGEPECVVVATGAECWFDASSPADGLAGILSYARDVFAEVDFWSRFARFQWSAVGPDAAFGRSISPVPETQCDFVVVRDEVASLTHAMNDSGFPSMGVFTTAIDSDCERALSSGATLRASPIATTVGGRSVRMALIETPNGALVELLSVLRSTAR